MIALICGGRDFNDRVWLYDFLDWYHKHYTITKIIEGDALGADKLAGAWGKTRGIEVVAVPADWKRYRNAAGPIRNKRMAEMKPDVCIPFPGGKGTANMVATATDFGIPICWPTREYEDDKGTGRAVRKKRVRGS
jgi:hypothetical protein